MWESYGPNSGVVSEPHSPHVQSRLDLLMYNMTQTVPFDAVFEDQVRGLPGPPCAEEPGDGCAARSRHVVAFSQIGARPWLPDLSPLEQPLATGYIKGWLNHTQVRPCLMLVAAARFSFRTETIGLTLVSPPRPDIC